MIIKGICLPARLLSQYSSRTKGICEWPYFLVAPPMSWLPFSSHLVNQSHHSIGPT